jgi:hypothetical protein
MIETQKQSNKKQNHKNNGKLATITRLILRILKTPILATLQIIDILIKHP